VFGKLRGKALRIRLSVSFSRVAAETSYLFAEHYPALSLRYVRPTTEAVAFRQRLILHKRLGHASDYLTAEKLLLSHGLFIPIRVYATVRFF
jgi:hypothetical protein